MAAWLESCYASQPLLHFGEQTISRCCGVQQREPFDPLGFVLPLHHIVEMIKREVLDFKINVWYLDDGAHCGSASVLCSTFAITEEEIPVRGLHPN